MDSTPEITKPRLLLADDSVTIRKVVELTFAEEGIDVVSASDGDAAMQRFVEQTPDIVLVDVEMPGQNGYQICEMIKGDESTKHIPVLLLVGSFEPFDQTEAERVQADGFLTKPFHSIRELVGKVRELIDETPDKESFAAEDDDIEELYNNSFAETVQLHEDDTEEDLEPQSFDDDMVEEIQVGPISENGFSDTISSAQTVQSNLGDTNWAHVAETLVTEADGARESDAHAEDPIVDPAIHDSKADTEEIASPFAVHFEPPASADIPGVTHAVPSEVSEEMITLIAKRVVEKLSDRVIRDIAQEAVPRIAEKLIREALEEEGRT